MQKDVLYRNMGIVQEAADYGKRLLQAKEMQDLDELLLDLQQLIHAMDRILQEEKGHLISLASRCCQNICASIDEFHSKPLLRERIFSLEIVNLIWNLDNILHRQYDVLNHPENWSAYRQRILQKSQAAHENVGGKKYRYKVTIFLMAYNKLEYTKAAIESIYQYTDFSKGDIELITINNGSDDGTREYFESLPNEKKINYKQNVLGVWHCPEIYEGEYRIDFSNDIVATPHWLDNLLLCIESDKKIAAVVPVCGDYSISCQQGIHVEYENSFAGMAEMECFAAQYNQSNPCLWEERALLMPFLACWRREVLDAGIIDNIYTQAEFIDDDLSTTLRRTGWKQILLRDTYMHHFGGITLNAARAAAQNNSLLNMRKVYYDKWGVDAWDSRGMYPKTVEFMTQIQLRKNSDILWIEPLYGSSYLALKQKFREERVEISTAAALVREEKYQLDAQAFFQQVIPVRDYEEWLEKSKKTYDLIGIGRYYNDIIKYEPIRLIQLLYQRLKPGGWLMMPVENRLGINMMQAFLAGEADLRFGNEDVVNKLLHVDRFFHALNTSVYPGQCIIKKYTVQGDAEKTGQLLSGLMNGGFHMDWERLRLQLLLNYAWIGIKKL